VLLQPQCRPALSSKGTQAPGLAPRQRGAAADYC